MRRIGSERASPYTAIGLEKTMIFVASFVGKQRRQEPGLAKHFDMDCG